MLLFSSSISSNASPAYVTKQTGFSVFEATFTKLLQSRYLGHLLGPYVQCFTKQSSHENYGQDYTR